MGFFPATAIVLMNHQGKIRGCVENLKAVGRRRSCLLTTIPVSLARYVKSMENACVRIAVVGKVQRALLAQEKPRGHGHLEDIPQAHR